MAIRSTATAALDASGGFELSLLFLLFLAINVAWECLLGLLRFLDDLTGRRGSLWISRVKEEILGLGVISLVLQFVEPQLLKARGMQQEEAESLHFIYKICLPQEADYGEEAGNETTTTEQHHARRTLLSGTDHHPCPEGKQHLFPKVIITASHYLLFYVAVVHVVYSFVSFVLSLQRFRCWVHWEQLERAHCPGVNLTALRPDAQQASASAYAHKTGPPRPVLISCWHCIKATWVLLAGGVSHSLFMGLRQLFLTKALLSILAEAPGPSGERDGAHQPTASPAPAQPRASDAGSPPGKGGTGSGDHQTRATAASPNAASSAGASTALVAPAGLLPPLELSSADARVLTGLHFANSAEQMVEVELSRVWAHAWALTLFTALFLLFPQKAWQAVWISGTAVLLTLVATVKMHLVLRAAASLGTTWPQRLAELHDMRCMQQRTSLLRIGGKSQGQAQGQGQGGDGGIQRRQQQPALKPGPADVEMGPANSPPGRMGGSPHLPTSTPTKSTATSDTTATATSASPAPSPSTGPIATPTKSALPADSATHLPPPAYTLSSAAACLDKLTKDLLWFGHALSLLWLINLVMVVNSLSITISIYFLIAYEPHTDEITDDWHYVLQTWVPVLIADTILAVYLGAVIIPQYALVSVCCGHSHGFIMRALKAHKKATQEPEEETGVSGLLLAGLFKLKKCCQACLGRLRGHPAAGALGNLSQAAQADTGAATTASIHLLEIFIRGLASRAGVLLTHDSHAPSRHPAAVLPLYAYMARVWMSKAVASVSIGPDPTDTWEVNEREVQVLNDSFAIIDCDGSGTVTLPELRERLEEVLEARPTTNELRAMVHTIDVNDDRQISLREYGIFLAHEYFAAGSLTPGTIDETSLQGALHALNAPPAFFEIAYTHAMLVYPNPGGLAALGRTPAPMTLHAFAALFGDCSVLD